MTDELKSPVASSSTKDKKWQAVILISLGVIMGGYMLFHKKSKAAEVPASEPAIQAPIFSPPQLANDVSQQLEQIQASLDKHPASSSARDEEQEETDKLVRMRMVAPTTVYSAGGSSSASSSTASPATKKSDSNVLGGAGASSDENSQFMSKVSASAAPIASATRIAHPATTLAQGTMIWATLESRIVSDLPGMVRAVTSENIYSEDGTLVMLPKGSRLIGQYTSAIAQGQQRVFVVWQRVIRPDHIDIQLNSPGTDGLGAAGVGADVIDNHFMEQFGTAALLSIISAGAANVGVGSQDQFNSASAYREGLSNSFSQTAQNVLKSKGTINPTIYINQGHAVSVFVARDLDFYNELTRS